MKRALIALSLLSIASFVCIKASEPLSKKLKPLANHEEGVEALPSPLVAQGRVETLPSDAEGEPSDKKHKTATEDKQETYQELLNKATGRPLEWLTHDLLSEKQTIWDCLPKELSNLIAQNVNSHSGVLNFVFERLNKEVMTPKNTEYIILHVGATTTITWSEKKHEMKITKKDSENALSCKLSRQPFISSDGSTMIIEEITKPTTLTFKVFELKNIWEHKKLVCVTELAHESKQLVERGYWFPYASFRFTNIENILYTDVNESFKVWNVKTGTCLFTGTTDECDILSFGGRQMVIEYGYGKNRSWYLQNIDDGTSSQLSLPETLLNGEKNDVYAALSKAGDTLALTGNGSLVIYNVEDLTCLHHLDDVGFCVGSEYGHTRSPFDLEYEPKSFRFSSTGNKLLLADDGQVSIFDVKRGILSQKQDVPLVDCHLYFLGRPTFSKRESLLIVPISGQNTEFCYVLVLAIESGTWLGTLDYERRIKEEDHANVGVTVSGNGILITSTGLTWNLETRLKALQKLKKLTLKQHQILNGIYRVCIATRLLAVKQLDDMCKFMNQSGYTCEPTDTYEGDRAYQQALINLAKSILAENKALRFDFNKYPVETERTYDALPLEIRSLFDRYVIRHKEAPTNNS